ncbi:MAG TPA: acetyl-CoA carboxylase biotin carboxyl carrier protein subunit [Bacteroidales bacterium]|nr:acetyl-CoA carboxylase biotin carboxyl carrier protein subunit [Bacteroidales bacterium]
MRNKEKLGTLNIDTTLYTTRLSRKYENRISYKAGNPKEIVSFIPGTVLDILVKPGQKVSAGEKLMILDAMKMQNLLKCTIDGKIKTIPVKKGDKVSKGTVLIILE